ncbi:MAG: hypothetical protein Q7T54_01470 [Candidatus Levybacteria bacterium]|nr:hypothetical protein [Candidatus Levybacteria bacterium]
MVEIDDIQYKRRDFFIAASRLLEQEDIFGQNPTIVRMAAKDFSISTIDDGKKCLRTTFFEPVGDSFEFVDAEHIFRPLEDGVLREGVLHELSVKS